MTGNTVKSRLLSISCAVLALILPGFAQLAQPSEATPSVQPQLAQSEATPSVQPQLAQSEATPSVQPQLAQPSEVPPSVPSYTSLISQSFASVKDVASYEDFEISGLRWVHSFKGWSWLACVHFTDRGHVRTYAFFIQNNVVVDGRYAVQTDACASQTYTPFDVVTGTFGRPTAFRLPPIY